MTTIHDLRRRPSVLHVFKIYYPDLFGGTLTVIRDICAGLKNRFAFAALVCSRSKEPRHIVVDDVSVERVRSFGDLLSMPLAPTYPLSLWRRIARHDLCALHAPFPLADLVFALGFGRRCPLVVHWHADIVTHATLRPLVEPLMRRTLRRAEAIIVSDAVLLRKTPLLREFADKVHVVPFGIDTSTYDRPALARDSEREDRARHPTVVLACGRLVPYKGFDVLLRAAAGQTFDVWIVGEGRERERLEQLVSTLGLGERVRLLGCVPDDELVQLMAKADVFVLPSVTSAETFGLAQLEAMAAGLPIVNTSLATAVPLIARDGIEAITVLPGDHEGLAEALNTLADDAELRDRMGRAGRLRARSVYSVDTFREGIDTVYRRAIADHAARHKPASRQDHAMPSSIRVAATLAWSDMRHRYVRSILGPFWMSLQMAVMVMVLGSVIGQMSDTGTAERLPMLAVSLTAWTFLSGVVLDATGALQGAGSLIKDRALPPIIFLLQCVFRQGLFALHNLCVPVVLWLLLARHGSAHLLAAMPGLVLFIGCTLGLGLVLGALATRYRDLKPIIESSLTLAFLSAPIIWTTDFISHGSIVLRLNPLTHLFAVWRDPLATGHVDIMSVVYVLVFAAILAIASVVAVARLRKAVFWI
ncbi:glycosyltransferase [Bradyrhizobium prioriisuperbiae]|uniref:glycosyltransferase n=1 Tax=Bradyrhizobium prioriisuperbiae TaxID=2854389 RepID=UPI0028EE8B90|nr:glycosyltransferase [Bradyrhizobium prioritasuperba]